ncbi:sigma-70 family RNA polymerase sigma factor [Nocardioides sp. SR21]|uniref:sigma-70 family RNA polymerase sigma factor n=1 Tax=Nocardioides sp. SR21 TaxID=2919501 RepID=UPI001FA97C70|nr:sigma-70 family RNA polymerase sigma factor [Nocardioides sp. SR21]
MASHISTIDGPSDGELISAVRGGDVDAYGELFARHVDAARRLARQLVPPGDVDDLVSEAFAKVLVVLQRGGGPDLAFRAYLLTAVRRLHVDRIRSTARLHTTGDLTPFDPGVPFRDTAVEGFESAAASRAFASLPERWQLVLWHTEVEQQKPAEVALLLGMTANSVSALAYRAREGLRQAYLSMHAADVDEDACARTRAALGAYVRGGLSRRDNGRVEEHLERCRRCAALYLELTEVNSRLGALLAPLLLGSAAAAYVGASSAGGVAAATGAVTVLAGRARDAVVSYGPTAAVAGAAAAVVAAGLFVTMRQDRPDGAVESTPVMTDLPAPSTTDPVLPAERVRVGAAGGTAPARSAPTPTASPDSVDPGTNPGTEPSDGPTAGPTGGPTGGPTREPSGQPSGQPSGGPSQVPTVPPQSPLAQIGVEASIGPDGIGVGATVGVLGLPPVVIDATVPAPALP